jgi:antitoxin MazE
MVTPIIQIGNSKGLRLSKTILEQYQIKDRVELILEEGQIVLRPIPQARSHWDAQFQSMRQAGDDALLMDDVFDDESFEE